MLSVNMRIIPKYKYEFFWSELKKRYALEVMAEQGEAKMCKGVINGKQYLISIATSEDGEYSRSLLESDLMLYPWTKNI